MTEDVASPAKKPRKEEAAPPAKQVRNVAVEVIRNRSKLPGSNHVLGKGYVTRLTVEEAQDAEKLGLIRIIGTV